MRKRLVVSNLWTWCGVVLCLAAGVFLAWQVSQSEDVGPLPKEYVTEPKAADSEAELDAYQLAPPERYEDILARPLFNQSRRPDPPRENLEAHGGGGTAEASAARVLLSGVVITRGKRVALVRLDNDPKLMHVAEGQQAGGWLIEVIRADRVVLRRGESRTEVALQYKRSNAVEAAPGEAPSAPATQDDSEVEEDGGLAR
jgi:hypothetical protein